MALDTVELLPTEPQRERLMAGLARLLEQRGHQPFVAGPLFEPCCEHFPEPLVASRRSIRTILRRLMSYAGLGELDVELEVYDSHHPYDEIDDDGNLVRAPHHAAAWFEGIDDGIAKFAVDVRQLDDLEKLVGILCHEVAHAYRYHHGLVVIDHEVEEELTDLTTIYLGFGIFTVNNSYRYRSAGSVVGYSAMHSWSEQRLGYLSPQALSFLLAAQVLVRDDPAEIRHVASMLEHTQREMVAAARKHLAAHDLLTELRLPARERWPAPADADALAADVAPASRDASDPRDDELLLDDRIVADNSDSRVYRLRDDRRLPFAVVFGVIGVALGYWMYTRGWVGIGMYAVAGLVTWLGYRVGQRFHFYLCLGHDCGGELSVDAERCARCGGLVAGTVDSPADVLDIEDSESA